MQHLTIDILHDIEERIQEKIHKFREKSIDEPEAILLGPVEYVSLCMRVSQLRLGRSEFAEVTEYLGYRVLPKTLPGIDFAIEHTRVPYHTITDGQGENSESAFRSYLKKLRGK